MGKGRQQQQLHNAFRGNRGGGGGEKGERKLPLWMWHILYRQTARLLPITSETSDHEYLQSEVKHVYSIHKLGSAIEPYAWF